MKKIKTFLIFLLIFQLHTYASVWYVKGNGNDQNNGKSESTAFQTLQHAADLVSPGDIVLVGDGIYTVPRTPEGPHVLTIDRSGRPDAWITWKAIKGQRPVIRPTGWGGIVVSGSYQVLDGLTVTGYNDAIVLVDALNDGKKEKADPYYNSNGIFINGRGKKDDEKPHHIIVRNCTVSKCPGGGIAIIEADYVTVEDCHVSENAWYMRYGGSGITTLDNWAYDDKPGYHMIIQRNMVWNNKTMVPWREVGRLSDGNGIILDVTDQENGAKNPNGDAAVNTSTDQNAVKKNKRPIWTGRALVANNISAYNGGSGIHAFRTSHVDIINNTTYWDGAIMGYPEVFANTCHDVVIMNNVIVPRPDGKVTSNSHNGPSDVKWDYNLYPITQDVFKAPHDIVADPNFKRVPSPPDIDTFSLQNSSQALGSATSDNPQESDLRGVKRPKGPGRDRGALEQ